MKRPDIEELFLDYAKAMFMDDWRFEFSFDRTEEELRSPAKVEIFRAHNKAVILIAKDKHKEWGIDMAQRICVHELMHCVVHSMFMVAHLLSETHLSGPDKQMFDMLYEREYELTVDRLTRLVIEEVS